jgi:hypothetical protein
MKKLLLTLSIIMMVFSVSAQVIEKTFYFSNPSFEKYQGYEQIKFDNCVQRGEVGEPTLPWFAVSLLLPQNTEAQDVEIEYSDFIDVEGSHLLYPYQAPRPVSSTKEIPFAKNENVYSSKEIYTTEHKSNVSTQYLNGYSFAFSGFSPVRYIPSEGKVSYAKSVTVRVTFSQSRDDKSKMLKTSPEVQARVKRLAQNPESLGLYSDNSKQRLMDGYELLVITPQEWVSHFDEYKAFYDARGIRTKVVALEDIYNSYYYGRDEQEQIRYFIKHEYENEGIMMVLLGGDSNIVPYRCLYCYVMEDYEDDCLPSDMYYVSLDGTWNEDDDYLWGETNEADLLPELAIGRMPFNNEYQFNNMMHKTLEYQSNPVLGEFNDIVLGGEHLGDGYYGSSDLEVIIGEQHDSGYTTIGIPEDYDFHRVYANGETGWSGSIFRDKINEVGGGYVHHVGHANTDYVAGWYVSSTNDESFKELDGVTHNYNFFHSHGCICGDFTSTCMLERLVNISTGFVAATGNSRYGWYIPWGDGPARHLHREFIDSYYNDRLPYIGTAFQEMKIMTAPLINSWGENGALRWNLYCINILGDVAVCPWLDEPFVPEISYEPAIKGGATATNIVIKKDDIAQNNFRCSMFKGNELIAFGLTDDDGAVNLDFETPMTEGDSLKLVVTGPNAICQTYDVVVMSQNVPFVYANKMEINDSEGNNNGVLDYNETIALDVDFYNIGTVKAENISATITTSTPDYVDIITSNATIGEVDVNTSVNIENAFSFKVKRDVPNQRYVHFTVTCTDGNDTWTQNYSYKVYAPELKMYELTYDDSMGNGNGFVEAGETILINIKGENAGHSKSEVITIEGSVSNPNASLVEDNVTLEGVDGKEDFDYVLKLVINDDIPNVEFFTVNVKLTSGLSVIEKELKFTIGIIKEDFETGNFSQLNWMFDDDLPWIVTGNVSYAGNFSAESGHIDHHEMSSLVIEIETCSGGELSFYCKTSTEKDCDYLIFSIDGSSKGRWCGETDWQYISYEIPAGIHTLEWCYDKNRLNIGGEDRCWIDEITFPGNSVVLSVDSYTEKKEFDLYPNPANTYIVVEGSDIKEVEIYDMMGRKVISSNVENSSSSVIYVDNLTNGIYLVRSIDVDNNVLTKKFIKK